MIISLTTYERERFAEYCKQEAATCEAMITQMEKLQTAMPLLEREKIHVVAFSIVADQLLDTEEGAID